MNLNHRVGLASDPFAVYFECLTPDGSHQQPKVGMVHGGNHTGSCYLNTLEDKPGWAYRFAEHGYEVLFRDWPGHERSGALDLKTLTSEETCEALAAPISTVDGPVVLLADSMDAAFGWRIAELCGNKTVAIVGIAPAPPGNIQPEPEILCESEVGLVLRTQFRTLTLHTEGAALATSPFHKDELVGDSTQFPPDRLDTYSKMLTHTGSRLIYERLSVRGSQVLVQEHACFTSKPVMIVTGGDDLEHPRHADQEVADRLSTTFRRGEHLRS